MSKQHKFKKYSVLGVEIDAVTNQQAIDYIMSQAADRSRRANYVTKPYVEFLDAAARDNQVVKLLNQSELCIPDGIALNWAVTYLYGGEHNFWRWLGTLFQIILSPKDIHYLLPGRASGINFAWPLLKASANRKLRVFLIGTPNNGKGDIAATTTAIKRRLPNINIAGHYGGYFPPGDEKTLIQLLLKTSPDLIMIGMGFPKQEKLMWHLSQKLTHGALIGEGGTFDYQSFGGKLVKAPQWMQKIGLEWLWRLILQPKRIVRQLAIPRFMWRVYREGKLTKSHK